MFSGEWKSAGMPVPTWSDLSGRPGLHKEEFPDEQEWEWEGEWRPEKDVR